MEEWEFRDRLRRLIEEKGLSARKMSRRLGRNDSYIQNILSGGALPSMRMFLKICAFLRITPETFWSGGADAGGVLAQKLRRLDERQLGVLSALVDILTARNGRSRSRRQGRRPPRRQASHAAGRKLFRPRAGGFPYCRPASLSCRWTADFRRCRAAHFPCRWAANFSYCRAGNSSCRREASFSRRCARAAVSYCRSIGRQIAICAFLPDTRAACRLPAGARGFWKPWPDGEV